jgi:serine/threonine-protein kinase ULK/ATG1
MACYVLTQLLLQETRHEVAIKTVSRGNLPTKLFENLKTEIDILKSLSRRHITKLINIIVRGVIHCSR